MFRDDKKIEQAQAQAAPMMGPMGGPFYGKPGMPTSPFQPMPGMQPDNCPGTSCPGMELARAYFCIQRFGPVFDCAKALEVGTLFPELYRPYHK
ncbi:spore coat associated protein CotJA [Desulforamulus aeronauticus]|uniref:Spore coat associated protein JA (CotJA) n=1 Tax=Desulforamulus aeronauticus DSM 10349 TaxID=1121421 RepID=A0A1M6UDU1_9FIRM|nr:spore coat associated protein CotJA [Desulforamulus aeronauticus]SHK67331.1 Spore coat associated protein JA (CotJA) [Desulforamulus aeronauticus DSM 10349]